MSERKQDRPFEAARAARLDDPARFAYLPPEALLALLAPAEGATLLDFGAGTATYTLEFARLRPDLHVIAYDLQPEMLELAKAKPAFGELGLKAALPDDLPRLRGTVDSLFALNLLHEIDDVDLIAMRALMHDGSHGLIVDWDAESARSVGPPRDHTHSLAEAVVRVGGYFAIEKTLDFPNHYGIVIRA